MPRKKNLSSDTEKEKFPTALRNLLEKKKLTHAQLGEMLGVRRQSIGQYATGQSYPSVNIVYDLMEKLNVSAEFILGLSEAEQLNNEVIRKELGIQEQSTECLRNFVSKEKLENKDLIKLEMLNYLIENIEDDLLENLYNYLFHDLEITESNKDNRVLLYACAPDNKDMLGMFYNTTLTQYFLVNLIEKLANLKKDIDKTLGDKKEWQALKSEKTDRLE